MDKEQIRLECLKLSVSKSVSYQEMIERAENFLVFVTEGKAGLDKRASSSARDDSGKGPRPAGQTAEVGPKSN